MTRTRASRLVPALLLTIVLGLAAPGRANTVCNDVIEGPNVCREVVNRICSIFPCTD